MPGIERAKNGRLWAVWVLRDCYDLTPGPGQPPAQNRLHLVTSEDEGKTWSHVLAIESPPGPLVGIWAPAIWHDPDGRLWLFWSQGTPYAGARHHNFEYGLKAGVWSMVTENSDRSRPTWSEPRRLCDGRMANKPVALSTGEWLFQTDITLAKGTREEMTQCRVFCSTDKGETFALRGGLNVPEGAHLEHMIVERRDGTLWMLIRVGGGIVRPGGDYVRPGIAESISPDLGRSWSPARRTAIEGPSSRFFLRRLLSGRILLINHYGFDCKVLSGRTHLAASLSQDEGASWYARLLLNGRPHERVCLPDAVQAPDGRIYVIYSDTMHDQESDPVARNIVLSCFSEQDIESGEITAEGSFSERRVTGLAPKPS